MTERLILFALTFPRAVEWGATLTRRSLSPAPGKFVLHACGLWLGSWGLIAAAFWLPKPVLGAEVRLGALGVGAVAGAISLALALVETWRFFWAWVAKDPISARAFMAPLLVVTNGVGVSAAAMAGLMWLAIAGGLGP